MTYRSHLLVPLILLALLFAASGCNSIGGLPAADEPAVQPAPTQAGELAATAPAREEPAVPSEPVAESAEAAPTDAPEEPAAESDAAPEPVEEAAPIQEEDCQEDFCIVAGRFVLQRPISPPGRNTIVTSNRFGEYRKATNGAYHGVFFLNSSGTPVVAVADGAVVVAGDDSYTPYGPSRNHYGNLVILEHNLPEFDDPVFTLYGHLSEVSVAIDDVVQVGQEIGKVGMTGSVNGSTLVFEVRYGENGYHTTRNPELWLKPLPTPDGQVAGALAGRIVNVEGSYLPAPNNLLLEQLAGPGVPAIDQFYLKTYTEKRLVGLDPWQENFAISDLPPGEYQISFMLNGLYQQVVTVEPGALTLVTFVIE